MKDRRIVIIGAGLAGFQLALSLRDGGHQGTITLVGEEAQPPYHRPPLSKAYMMGQSDEARLGMRAPEFYADRKIELLAGRRAVAVDRVQRRVQLDDGSSLAYEHLVFATGARNRTLPAPGADLAGVHYLRTLDDARQLKAALDGVQEVVVIGAGFIGLEFAAVARKLGVGVTVVDMAERAMARAISPATSALFEAAHRDKGIRLHFRAGIEALQGEAGRVTGVRLSDGRLLPCQLVLVGIGVIPNAELAQGCGLATANGIVVDAQMQTSDPAISAIGDCAAHPSIHAGGSSIRIESVQNATDQARGLAARLLADEKAGPYASVPWFWSDQGELKLQIVGLTQAGDLTVAPGGTATAPCSIYCFRQGRLVGVESVNRPGDHMAARKLLALMSGASPLAGPPPELVAAPGFDLKQYVATLDAQASA